jgi:hypothetical protein
MRYQGALARTTLERLAERRLSEGAPMNGRQRAADAPLTVDGA